MNAQHRLHFATVLLIPAAFLIAGALAPQKGRVPQTALAPGTIGMVDTPIAEAVKGSSVYVAGWALDRAGIRGVEIRLDGRRYAARYGVPRADVANARPGYPDSRAAGFEFEGNFSPLEPARHELSIVAITQSGSEAVLTRKSLLPIEALAEWQPLYAQRPHTAAQPFYVLPGLSGVGLGGAEELDDAYAPYLSPTLTVGMRVPILYLRTTLGSEHDWTFDPDWDVDRRCGERRIAEDSLSEVIAYSVKHKLPVLFTLNGGIWADAVCDVPSWDINDHLEQFKQNCQWNEHDEVMPDDYLKGLPGATKAPELGRSLTFNVYATSNRHYKRRNLQAAGRLIADFARKNPGLFVGVNLDPDTYLNPFYAEQQWYDYNPGTLKQFRQWLAGSGPYAGKPEPGVPNLSRYRRKRLLTLSEVRILAAIPFQSWDDVDPPRRFSLAGKPFWEDPWTHEWEVFRRHLVKLHYDELSQWLAEVGIPRASIFSSQGFVAPDISSDPFAINLASPTKNHDSGGLSVEGAIPADGHLGAILYGAGAINDVRMERASNLFATFEQMDPGWGVVEFNTADFRTPAKLPNYAMGYRALREMFNYGARFASPMAWNGSSGLDAGQPGYVSFMAWRNTLLEAAMRDFAVSHAFVPLGARLWTFGSPSFADTDGWTAGGADLHSGNGYIEVVATTGAFMLISPAQLVLGRDQTDLLVLGVTREAVDTVAVDARAPDGSWIALGRQRRARSLAITPAGISVPLDWPPTLSRADQVRVRLTVRGNRPPTRVRHIALYPPPSTH